MTYPQTKDWPTDEARMDVIGSNGNDGDHYDLTNYLSEKDEMSALKKEVVDLRESNRKLKNNVADWKCKYKKMHAQAKDKCAVLSRGQKATAMIKDTLLNGFEGFSITQIKLIAKANHLSVIHTQDLWYSVLKNQNFATKYQG